MTYHACSMIWGFILLLESVLRSYFKWDKGFRAWIQNLEPQDQAGP
ncbi:MAG: hypothetical protein HGA97_06835 [Chlorobiaceae bacterium]|nr:hypothetical protein [Chlorobiaceae bacterium]